jgi:hypothetical protein
VDGPVVNAGAINYGAGGGSNANIGDFVFSNTEMTTTGNDIYIKSPDDLFLDALGDDVIIRADDDIRFRPGYDFDTDTYTWELRYTDGGSAIFYNSTSGNDFGYIRPVDNAGSLGMSYEGVNDAYVKSNNGNNTWKFASNGDLTLPSGGDIKDSTGVSVLGAGGISLSNISVTSNSPSGNGSLTYSNTTGVFTFTPADASLSNYGNSNVVTLLSSFGSNTLVTTGNISGGNVISSGKFVGDGSALTNVTVSVAGNITGTSQNVSLVAGSFTATFDNTGILTLPRMGGDEGGEINFGVPATNTTLSTRVVLDVYQDRLRIFDGNTKGAYIDLSQAATGVGTLLNNRVSGLVNAGTFVTMDLIKATVTTSGNRGLSLATTTGSFAYNIGGTYGTATPASGGSAGNGTLTTTATASIFNWGFTNQGDTATYILTDTTNSIAYRITLQIGNAFNNNMISIERLI